MNNQSIILELRGRKVEVSIDDITFGLDPQDDNATVDYATFIDSGESLSLQELIDISEKEQHALSELHAELLEAYYTEEESEEEYG